MKERRFQPNPKNLFDTEMRLKALRESEERHQAKMENESRGGIPSSEESLVSDYLRNRVGPPEDMVSGRKIFEVETIKQSEDYYKKDYKKLKSLTESELYPLLTAMEENRAETARITMGKKLHGYAIDPKTLQSLETTEHHTTNLELARKILQQEADSGNLHTEYYFLQNRIIRGFVYLEVPGFETPIVKLFLDNPEDKIKIPKEDMEKVANYLKREGKLLPIDSDYEVL